MPSFPGLRSASARGLTVLLTGLLTAGALVGLTTSAGAAPRTPPERGPVSHATGIDTRAEQDAVRAFWTSARLRAAVPRGGERPLTGRQARSSSAQESSAPSLGDAWTAGRDTVGKVFFQMGTSLYVCSGNAVDDVEDGIVTRNLVVTAGHCVNDGGSAFATHVLFIPRYDPSKPRTSGQPFGTFAATRLTTTGEWAAQGSERFNYDVGMALVGTNELGVTLTTAVGDTSDIGFVGGDPGATGGVDYTVDTHAFGYPAAAPYDGTRLISCWGSTTSDSVGFSTDYRLPCDMTGGSSGGPWLVDATAVDPSAPIDNGDVSDLQISVNSFGYVGETGAMYGPIFGSTIQKLYDATVALNGPADTAPPVLSEFDFTPKAVDVAGGSQTVTVTARVTDATGAEAPTMLIGSDTTTQTAGFGTMALVSGDARDGVWSRTVTIPATAAPGDWTVTIYPLADTVGNGETGFHDHPSKLSVTNGPDTPQAAVPDAPTQVWATRGNGSAAVSWNAPADNGSPITSYAVTAMPGGQSVTVSGDTISVTMAGLANGTAYTFTVTATNALGAGSASAPSEAVTPATTPGRVARPVVMVSGRKAVIRWSAPVDGGSALTGYRVIVDGKARTTSPDRHRLVVRKLAPGRHKVRVFAVNEVGAGPTSDATKFRIRST